MKIIRYAKELTEKNDGFGKYYEIATNCIPLRIWFLTDDIVRIRAGFDCAKGGKNGLVDDVTGGNFREASYSLRLTAWEDKLDSFFGNKRTRVQVASSKITSDDSDKTVIQGEKLRVQIQKNPFVIKIFDLDGNLLHSDIPDLAYMEDSNHRRIHTSEISQTDCFYGFGEKTGELNKAETSMSMSPKDTMGYNPAKSDSLYKHIPFYIRLQKNRVGTNFSSIATGYFYHNTAECDFDTGREHSNYWPHHSRYRVDSGDIDLFFIAGPTIRQVVQRYTDLTGKSALLPKSAFGYLGSSMYYSELPKDCDDEIIKFIDTAKAEQIPIDGFQLSSGYTSQKTCEGEKRCVFTWNKERFKNPKDFFVQMEKRGITVSPNVKPGILLCHPDMENFIHKDLFVHPSEDALAEEKSVGKNAKNAPAVGTWWGGKGAFVDFTNPKVREEWKKLLTENVLDYGTTSVWNDNCEYDSLVDKDSVCDYEGIGGKIGDLKAVMSNLMCYVTEDAVAKKNPDVRPFIVCRSGHSGIQTVAQTWAGDNRTGWDTLKFNMSTILGMALCGVSNYGCDIGGFYGPSPDAELFVRWVQNGIFQSRFSIHSVNTDNTVTEPWMYSDCTKYIRDAIQFRYALFPYMYSLAYRAHIKGESIWEPLCLAFQNDEKVLETFTEFMMGDSLYVAPVIEQGAKTRKFYLPNNAACGEKTTKWYDFWKRSEYEGGCEYEIPVGIGDVPLFVKAGAIIPLADNQMFNLATESVTDLHLLCACDISSETTSDFTLYEDDGVTTGYEKGEFQKTSITLKSGIQTQIEFSAEGNYKSSVKNILLDVIAREKCPFFVRLEDTELKHFINRKEWENAQSGWYYSQSKKSVLIKYPQSKVADLKNYSVHISFAEFNMLGM